MSQTDPSKWLRNITEDFHFEIFQEAVEVSKKGCPYLLKIKELMLLMGFHPPPLSTEFLRLSRMDSSPTDTANDFFSLVFCGIISFNNWNNVPICLWTLQKRIP